MKAKINSKLTQLFDARNSIIQEINNLKQLHDSKQAELISITGAINTLQELLEEDLEETDKTVGEV